MGLTRTEYLTGYPPERYEAELIPLRLKRIADMDKLLEELLISAGNLERDSIPYNETIKRLVEVQQAKAWWNHLI